ncbi:hypothetical protein [Treponema sp. R80B11-R83G3]
MKKKFALVLIMVMLVNMIAWADTSTEKEKKEEEETLGALVVIGVVVVAALLVTGIFALLSEADAPDDGIKLTSMETAFAPETLSGSFMKLLQHVEFGQKQNGDIYAGFRFQY